MEIFYIKIGRNSQNSTGSFFLNFIIYQIPYMYQQSISRLSFDACCNTISKSCLFFCKTVCSIIPVKNDCTAASIVNPHTIKVGNPGTIPVSKYSQKTGIKNPADSEAIAIAIPPKNNMHNFFSSFRKSKTKKKAMITIVSPMKNVSGFKTALSNKPVRNRP